MVNFKMSICRNVHLDEIKCILLKNTYADAQMCTQTFLKEKRSKYTKVSCFVDWENLEKYFQRRV